MAKAVYPTREQEARILASPATRRLVHQVLRAAEFCDPVDAIKDVGTALAILEARCDRMLAACSPAPAGKAVTA